MAQSTDDLLCELTQIRNRILSMSTQLFTPNSFADYDARMLALEQLKVMQEYAEMLVYRIELSTDNN